MIERSRLVNVLLVLLILIAALFLAQMLWQFLSAYADVLVLFALSWLVSFILNPIVAQVSERPVPQPLTRILEPLIGRARAMRVANARLSRGAAVLIVYVGLLLAIVLGVALLVPGIVIQLSQLASHLPDYMARAPDLSRWVEGELAGRGINVSVDQAVQNMLAGLQNIAGGIIQNALTILTSAVSLLANVVLVLLLGFYMTLDGPRLERSLLSLAPIEFQAELRFFGASVNRTFGGFVRGQLLQAVFIGIGTAIAMMLFGLDFVLVASLFASLFMLIPLIGPFLALLPPFLVALLEIPGLAVWLLIMLFVFQFIVVNVLMPRLLSEALGLHPLLVFAAILLGIKIGGFWGAFFGIPIAGVIWAMLVFFYETWIMGRPEVTEPTRQSDKEKRRQGDKGLEELEEVVR